MNNSIYKVLVIVFSFSLSVLVLDCTREKNVFGAEFEFPEELLSQEVEWEKCEFIETKKRPRKAECANITVPLDWENQAGDTIKIYVKRLKSLLKAKRQMWWLEGGPGAAGTATLPEQFMKPLANLDWRTDLYVLDHRGTGNSNRLGCPEQETDDSEKGVMLSETEWDACIEYLEDTYNLDAFTVTQAAKDLGFLIELLKEKDKEIFVYGYSYGTYWGHRYAQIFPDQANGLILDSVAPSVGSEVDRIDILGNDVVSDFFDICKKDEFCSNQFEGDPWEKADDTFKKFQGGHCPEVVENGLTPENLQSVSLSALDFWGLRIVLPALYYRLERCNEKDVSVFKHLSDNVLPAFSRSSSARQFSDALRYHIELSELISDNPMSVEEMKEIDKTLLATSHFAANNVLPLLKKGWPTYDTDMYYHEWASPNIPILMLLGTLDQRSPIAMVNTAKENLTGSNQYFIEVPNANHGVIKNSPVKNLFAPDCGMQIILNYMEDPLEEPDTSCLDNLKSIDFRGNPLLALVLFGTWDLWE